MLKTISLALITTALSTSAFAADNLPTKALSQLSAGYPTHCGMFFGVGTGGSAGAVTSSVANTQVVQGDLDGLVGYTCPFATNGFWFVEGQAGVANLNGGNVLANNALGGIQVSGPAVFIERFGVGSPLNGILGGLIPGNNNFLSGLSAAVPSVPLLPAGVTLSPANLYTFAGLVEADYGVTLGLTSGHQYMVSPMIGLGNLQRASNNMMIDTWAGFQFGSTNSICPGAGNKCAQLGNMVRVGASIKY